MSTTESPVYNLLGEDGYTVEQLDENLVFEFIKIGQLTQSQFAEWVSFIRSSAYEDGANNQAYTMSIG